MKVSVATDKMDEMRIYMMEIKVLDQFETMDTETLATIEGGMTWAEIGAIVGATIGSFYIPNPVIVPFRVR